MGATYTRQSSYTDGDVITAAHTNDEFNQLLAAFQASTGHTHDGTANEGGPITKLVSNTLTFGAGTAGTDITVTYDGESNDGVMKWMEDEDYFEFSDDILIASTEKLQFRDTAIYINSSADGQLDLVADTEIQIAATTVDINGAVDISGNLTVGGSVVIGSANISEAELEVLDGATITTDELNIIDGGTSATSVTVADADRLVLNDDGTMKQIAVTSLAAYMDDKITAMPNLTSVGTLSSLTMDSNTAGKLLVADGTNFSSTAVGDLSEISTVANDDVFLAVDTSGGGLKKITRSAVVAGLATSSAISNVSEDSTPQLGGDLDVNGNGLTSTSNGNIAITPNGTGVVRLDGNVDIQSGLIDLKNSGAVSKIKFYCESSNAHAQTVQGAPHSESASNTLTLPSTGGDTTLVSASSTETLTNKTLTTPVIAEIDSGSTITLDATTDIILDADGGDIFFKDGGTTFGSATNTSGNLILKSGTTTALTFDGANVAVAGNLSVAGTTTTVNTVTMEAANAVVFEGATADSSETTLTIVDPTADRTINLPNQSGTIPVLAAASNTAITSTPEELNILDGVTSTAAELNILDGVTSTATELNIMDGDTSASATTLVDADRVVTNDNGTMKQVALSDVKTYLSSAGFSTEDPTALAIALG